MIADHAMINPDEARKFLHVIDSRTERFTFQTFDDSKDRRDRSLTHTFHGTLDEHFPTLLNLNLRGAGVFVTINSTNFQERTTECIDEVRCYFADFDGASPNNLQRLALQPHIIVETSPGKYQAFFNIEDAPLNAEHFKRTQLNLATLFNSDSSVCDLPRVMRLPGFLHQKNPAIPFAARIARDNSQADIYTEEDFQHALASALATQVHAPTATAATAGSGHTKRTITDLLGPIPECLRARPYRGLVDRILSDYPPSYAADIVEQCGQLREMRDKRGRISEPTWQDNLGVLAFCEDGDALAHAYSSGDPRYTHNETQGRLDRWRNFGPTTCKKFHEDNPTICEACPLWDKSKGESRIKSPIVLGRRQPPMPAAAETVPGAGRETPLERPQEQGIEIIRGDALLSTAAPPRSWLVEKFIPDAEVTMLGGDGGTGKTTLALQLASGCVSCGNWMNLKVKPCNVLYISAEDPRDEIHYRLEKIIEGMRTARADLARLALVDLAGKDSTIATFDKNGLIKPTPLFAAIEKAAREHTAACIIFDSVADFFGGNENERREVRAFIGLLRGLAMRLSAAVVILAHPSVDGIKTGRGYSGSTHWNNAVRSRMYFTSPEKNDESPPNPDARLLELVKSNRTRSGEKIHLVWHAGLFHGVSPEVAGRPPNSTQAEELFLHLLSKLSKQGMHVSPYRSVSYAPTVMAKMPASKGIGRAALEGAMHQLLDRGKIRVTAYGPPSRRTRHLEVCTDHDATAGRGFTGSQAPGPQPGAPLGDPGGYGGSEHTPV
jgi:RecA-family ATPase